MGFVIHDRSQESCILQLLNEAEGDGWVSALALSQVSLQYCARICCLRRSGVQIENKLEIQDGRRRGYYRLSRPIVQASLLPESEMGARWHDPEERL